MGSSGGIYADVHVPLTQRSTRLLLDVLGAVHESLVEHAVTADLNLALLGPLLDRFAEAITELEVVGEVHRETKHETRADREDSSALRVALLEEAGSGSHPNEHTQIVLTGREPFGGVGRSTVSRSFRQCGEGVG
jgi:hypothetical protein